MITEITLISFKYINNVWGIKEIYRLSIFLSMFSKNYKNGFLICIIPLPTFYLEILFPNFHWWYFPQLWVHCGVYCPPAQQEQRRNCLCELSSSSGFSPCPHISWRQILSTLPSSPVIFITGTPSYIFIVNILVSHLVFLNWPFQSINIFKSFVIIRLRFADLIFVPLCPTELK